MSSATQGGGRGEETMPPPRPPSSSPVDALLHWISANYAEPLSSLRQLARTGYITFVFCVALLLGALKAAVVGPVAGLLLILGNVGVVFGLFPAHVAWTVYSLIRTNKINAALKFAFLFALPLLFSLWLVLGISGSVLVGIGYGFFTPWVSTFEAFRLNSQALKFKHCIVDGTWSTIKGSCTVVRDFADICYHSYPLYLKELRESSAESQLYEIRLMEVPACIVVGLIGLVIDLPLYTAIAVVKSPYMLFKGWQRLLHDLISREGPFLETACVPIAGLAIVFWPLIVAGSILLAIVSSIFVGLYGSVVVYQERSFQRGIAYVIAMVAEFDEYTNDWLYLREGSILPRPQYRKRKVSHSAELSLGASTARRKVINAPMEAPAMLVPSLAPSRSVREAIQDVKMVQIWEDWMKSTETRGKDLVDDRIIKSSDLNEWLRSKGSNQDIVTVGLPSYSFLHNLLYSIKSGSVGLLLSDGIEVTHVNRPQDRLLDWFFHPVLVLKEQIRIMKLRDEEVKFLEKLVLSNGNAPTMEVWASISVLLPQDEVRTAQIQAISRRLMGMTRSISKLPTYRRRYRQVVKDLLEYCLEKEGFSGSRRSSIKSSLSAGEIVPAEV